MQVEIGDELHFANAEPPSEPRSSTASAGCYSQYVYPVLCQYLWNDYFVDMITEVDRMFIATGEKDFRRFENQRINEPTSDYVLHQHQPNRYWFYMFDRMGDIWDTVSFKI